MITNQLQVNFLFTDNISIFNQKFNYKFLSSFKVRNDHLISMNIFTIVHNWKISVFSWKCTAILNFHSNNKMFFIQRDFRARNFCKFFDDNNLWNRWIILKNFLLEVSLINLIIFFFFTFFKFSRIFISFKLRFYIRRSWFWFFRLIYIIK